MIKHKMIMAHLRAAQAYAETSYAVRLQVGAVIVNQLTDQPVSAGWNGMPPGEPNICEHEVDGQLISKDTVVHAEINALSKIPPKLPRDFLTLFVTDSPCPVCAKRIAVEGIRQVIFTRRYRLDEGIKILLSNGVEVYHGPDKELKLLNGEIVEGDAFYSEDMILSCRNFREGAMVKPHGLAKHNVPWTFPERELVLEMFLADSSVEQIAQKTGRSYSSICSFLTRKSMLSWATHQGYMIGSRDGIGFNRVLWCRIEQIAYNKKAIEDALKAAEPIIKDFMWDHKGCTLADVQAMFPHIAPIFLKRITKLNN